MTKHTPGPWHVANGVQIRSARDQVAKVWMMRNGEGNANARLLAAAPNLLDMLKEAVRIIDIAFNYDGDVFGKNHNDAVDALIDARAIIIQAEGEQK